MGKKINKEKNCYIIKDSDYGSLFRSSCYIHPIGRKDNCS